MKTIFNINRSKIKLTKFVEYGFDPDNNRYLFGISTEIELPDGTEQRVRGRVPIKLHEVYIRIWVLRIVFCIGNRSLSLKIKDRYSLNFVIGFGGE